MIKINLDKYPDIKEIVEKSKDNVIFECNSKKYLLISPTDLVMAYDDQSQVKSLFEIHPDNCTVEQYNKYKKEFNEFLDTFFKPNKKLN